MRQLLGILGWLVACLPLPIVAQPPAQATGRLVEGVQSARDPRETYTLYLPSEYTEERRWPALLVFDPRGRSKLAAELFRDAAETYGWIVLSSDGTRSDGPMEPNRRALAALWPEVHERYATDPRRIYAAGFSGGAMLGWALGRSTTAGELAGVIGSGGRLEAENLEKKMTFPCFGAAGTTDFNYSQMRRVHEQLAIWGTPQRLEFFDGQHRWMPAELAREGVEWLELQAMKAGLRPRDGELIEALYQRDAEKAGQLEASGRLLEAMRRYAAIAATFEGLRGIEEAQGAAARLEGTGAVAQALRQEKRGDDFERSYLRRMFTALARLRADPELSARRLVVELRISDLHKRAADPSYEGVVARRLLETLFTQSYFYLTRDALSRDDLEAAVKSLTVASEVKPERPDVWLRLARILARSGSRKPAIEALEKAVAAGFDDVEGLESDPDLEPLRRMEGYRRLVAGLGL